MKLLKRKTNKLLEAEIVEIDEVEVKTIMKSSRFDFDWNQEIKYSVYKICLENENTALGLMSIVDVKDEYRIHINLIENSNDNKGKSKEIDRVAGCLIAYAARIAFDKGYMGFTSLFPKTELISLYVNKYGFKQFGRQLALDRIEAIKIINKYL